MYGPAIIKIAYYTPSYSDFVKIYALPHPRGYIMIRLMMPILINYLYDIMIIYIYIKLICVCVKRCQHFINDDIYDTISICFCSATGSSSLDASKLILICHIIFEQQVLNQCPTLISFLFCICIYICIIYGIFK